MSLKIALVVGFSAFILLVFCALLLIMPRERVNESESSKYGGVTHERLGHAEKPSPGVALNKNTPSGSKAPAEANTASPPTQLWPPDGRQFVAHHKGVKGCDGMLILKAAGLQFTCPGDADKSFFVALHDIRGTNDDGIITVNGKRYHFDKLPAGGKDYVERLFSDWLARVRPAQPRSQ